MGGGERRAREGPGGGAMALAGKMASLPIKSLAKPLASVFQQWVLSRPEARRVAIAGAQRLHRMDVSITRYGLAPYPAGVAVAGGRPRPPTRPTLPRPPCLPFPPAVREVRRRWQLWAGQGRGGMQA